MKSLKNPYRCNIRAMCTVTVWVGDFLKQFKTSGLLMKIFYVEAVNIKAVQYRVRLISRKYNKFQKITKCKANKRKAAQLYGV